jgi:DNA-binding NtrC family response regulator
MKPAIKQSSFKFVPVMPGNILIIDDEEQLRKLLGRIISLEGFSVRDASTLKQAKDILERQPIDIILCDVRLTDGNGVEFVKSIKAAHPKIEIILITAYGNIPDGVQAIKNGAFDYLVKGNDNDKIIPLLNQAMEYAGRKRKEAIRIDEITKTDFSSIIGNSEEIRSAIKLARKMAETDTTVLLLGETGTGKEVFANAIHQNSHRKGHSFVAINCSAFPKDLLESELFGHKAGAFTSAVKEKKGLIEMANGGTLFLDEIGDLDHGLQAKLLRVLENGEYIKLGDTRISTADIRIIAATNRDLKKQVETGSFREDLYYRINVFSISLPPLRERMKDIPELFQYFLDNKTHRERKKMVSVDPQALQLLTSYYWKGNIRELKNVAERAYILSDEQTILSENLPFEIQSQLVNQDLSLSSVEKQHIQKILQHTGGNKARTARILQIGIATLYRKMEEYHLS